MSTEHKRYLRQEAVKQDVTQTIFSSNGSLLTSKPTIFAEATGIDSSKTVMCPFCLESSRLQVFLVSTQKGLSQSRGECPGCHNGMLLRTLLKSWTPEAYAEWVFSYARGGFWQKINFESWSRKLKELGWAQPFWDIYRRLKGSDESENYGDYMNRKGEEEAANWSREQPGE